MTKKKVKATPMVPVRDERPIVEMLYSMSDRLRDEYHGEAAIVLLDAALELEHGHGSFTKCHKVIGMIRKGEYEVTEAGVRQSELQDIEDLLLNLSGYWKDC